MCSKKNSGTICSTKLFELIILSFSICSVDFHPIVNKRTCVQDSIYYNYGRDHDKTYINSY